MKLRLPLLLGLMLFLNPLIYGMKGPLRQKENNPKKSRIICASATLAAVSLVLLSVSIWGIMKYAQRNNSNDNNSCNLPSNVYWKAAIPLLNSRTGKTKTALYEHLCPTAKSEVMRKVIDYVLYDQCPRNFSRPWFYDFEHDTPCFGSSTASINGTCSDLDDVARDLGNKCGTNTPIPTTRNALQRQNNVMHGRLTNSARLRHKFARI